ncbi:MAG: RpiB/LacA/LacB family sugar-phosphate isomerase [Bacilli bacterium]|nr:RpiB/LacA/LacB family sugar-phosphate isomerase [Bacilli bacterium]
MNNTNVKNIIIASDHGGFAYKNDIKEYLESKHYLIDDVGTFFSDSCDYPKIVDDVFKKFSTYKNKENIFIILFCKTGIGISIAANRFKNIRCGIGYDDDVVRLMRQHNNANAIAFGSSFMTLEDCKRRIDIFLNTNFEGGRHLKRVNMLENYGS